MFRTLMLFAFITLFGQAAQAATPFNTMVDVTLMSSCAARTDAHMDSMTSRKLEQIHNYEFSLRMAMAQFAGGTEAMSPNEWQQAIVQLHDARYELAQVCDVSVPSVG